MKTPLVRLEALAKSYASVPAVHPLDLEFDTGDFLAILGPSGCGKTTLLKMLGGFVPPTSGRILIGGEDVTQLPPERRPTNMVFQGYGLFPHMTVRQNIAYGPRIAREDKNLLARRVDDMLALVRLTEFGDQYPGALSGGQQQRVALARALMMRPKVLLLDEPFAALDLKLRQAMQEELRTIHKNIGGTFVFVTHDQAEAMALASKVVVMSKGRVEQVGSGEEIYRRPKTRFVSQFVGEANFFAAERKDNRVSIPGAFTFEDHGPDCPVQVGVRPERVLLGARTKQSVQSFNARIIDRLFLGAQVQYRVALPDGVTFLATTAEGTLQIGETTSVGWSAEDQWVVQA